MVLALIFIAVGVLIALKAMADHTARVQVEILRKTEEEVHGVTPTAPPPGRDRTRDVESG